MTMQIQGATVALTVRTQALGAPTLEGDGVALSQFNHAGGPNHPKRFFVQVNVSNVGTSCQLTLWLRSKAGGSGVWGIPVDASGNFGVFGNGSALPSNASYYFIFEDVGGCSEAVVVQHDNAGGTPVVTATMAPLIEGGE